MGGQGRPASGTEDEAEHHCHQNIIESDFPLSETINIASFFFFPFLAVKTVFPKHRHSLLLLLYRTYRHGVSIAPSAVRNDAV